MRGYSLLICNLSVALVLMFNIVPAGSFPDEMTVANDGIQPNPPSRSAVDEGEHGMVWYDDFSNESSISYMEKSVLKNGKISTREVVWSE